MSEPILHQTVKWREQYVSSALNAKFFGVIRPGIYKGFFLSPSPNPMNVIVDNGDSTCSVAVVDRDQRSLTITMHDEGEVKIPAKGTWLICIEAYYAPTQIGYQRIVARERAEKHHIILGTVIATGDDVIITAENISLAQRQQSTIPTSDDITLLWKHVDILSARDSHDWKTSQKISANSIVELPLSYEVGSDSLLLFCECCGLLRPPYIEEIGVIGERSTSIRVAFDIPAGVMLTQILIAGGVSGSPTGEAGGTGSLPTDVLQMINDAVATAKAASIRANESADRADQAAENLGIPITLKNTD